MKQDNLFTILGFTVISMIIPQLMADYPIAAHRYLADIAT